MSREESMKKLIVFLFSLILSVVFSTSALAYDVMIRGIYYNLNSEGKTAVVTRNWDNKYSGEVVIPSSITVEGLEYTVSSIGEFAFSDCSGLTSITIPNSVTSIGREAFFYCSGLTSVTIPNSVTSIGVRTFEGCTGLTSVTIPNSVTSIGDLAFSGCSGLKDVIIVNNMFVHLPETHSGHYSIPENISQIIGGAFYNCSGLTSVTIPNSVTSIGDCAFIYCSGLEDIIIVNNMFVHLPVTYSGHYSIPENISQIIGGAFNNCKGLTSVTIPNSVTSIGGAAFYNCKGLTSVTIPNSVTNIGDWAFDGCSGLTSVTIPNSVKSIEEYTFSGCSGLTTVDIPNSVTSIGDRAFCSCSGLRSLAIPNSVISIGSDAFCDCSRLTSITIPNSVQHIEKEAFAQCIILENVYCYAKEFSYIDWSIFSRSNIEFATLHVPSSALSYYQTTRPWSGFRTIKALEGTEAEAKKCEKPVISYANGELDFTCSTEGVEFASEIKCKDVNKFNTSKVSLSACYDISVTATKAGYDNSDVATAKLYWLPTADIGTNINTAKTRGIVIQSAGGFITLSGLNTNERVDFFAIDGAALGSATATDGTATFSAKSGTIVIAKIGKESVKIAVE